MQSVLKRLFFLFFLLIIPVTTLASSMTFNDNFDTGIDDWTAKIGTWANPDDALQSTGGGYSTIWRNDSNQGGLYQSITVDAYFDVADSDWSDKIAQLRLRTGEHTGATQPFWDTGYLASFQTNGIYLQDTYLNSNPYLGTYTATNPFSSTGWYTLRFEVAGRGANTNLKLWVGDTLYLDVDYNDADGSNDNGYIGLGRLIRYDNASGYSSDDMPAVPEPATLFLFGIGLLGIAGLGRNKKA